jgi:cyclopropane fatty-acyl-phospholipid synthase-like methyltransferase
MQTDFDVPANWYEHFFTGPVNRFWETMVPPEITAADLAFVERHIAVAPPARILDVPCGAGRHALALAERGFSVTGVDLSKDAVARATAAAAAAGLPARFVRSDMRDFAADDPFDAALCLGNSIGYFGPPGMTAFFGRLAAALRRGGRLVLDTSICAESILPPPQEREIAFERGSYRSRYAYDAMESVLKTEAELMLDGERHQLRYAHHIVTSGTLVQMLHEAGLATLALHGGTDDVPFAPGNPRLLLVAERR